MDFTQKAIFTYMLRNMNISYDLKINFPTVIIIIII